MHVHWVGGAVFVEVCFWVRLMVRRPQKRYVPPLLS